MHNDDTASPQTVMSALMLQIRGQARRIVPLLLADLLLICGALYGAFLLRFDGQIPAQWLHALRSFLLLAIAIKIPVFYLLGLYRMSWAHVSVRELLSIFIAVSLSSSLLGTSFFLFRDELFTGAFPRSILILDYVLTLVLLGALRFAKRIHMGLSSGFSRQGRRVLIVGAGNAGDQIVRAMLRETRSLYLPMGFVDDDPAKQGVALHGIRVLGRRREIPSLVGKYGVQELLIAMPSAPPRLIRETVELGRRAGLQHIRIIPGLPELVSGRISLSDIREVQLEDLLGRDLVRIEAHEIEAYLKEKVVLVTGACGSIGAELCRHISKFSPKTLLALDQNETGLFYLEQDVHQKMPSLEIQVIVADVRDTTRVEQVFERYRPQVVFHAAAYKHVPLMEIYPEEAVKNNVFGTLTVAEAAQKWNAGKFVLISTDKAVNPTSVMGATKRVAELIIQTLHREQKGETRFAAVRFGNVLGSRGSVIPIFREQIRRGGPVTVTHEEMQRYVMVASEAAMLVLQAGAMSQGGEVFVLNMGEPIKIVDLARELIRLSGYEPDKDIPIVFTGQRPGEKLFEELLTAKEGTMATEHEQIFIARMGTALPKATLREQLLALERSASQGSRPEILSVLQEIVPTFRPAPAGDGSALV
jgi:FlaA1/EpsC-like NDP-sugar epimerase